jgi:uncharacterized protein YjaZ
VDDDERGCFLKREQTAGTNELIERFNQEIYDLRPHNTVKDSCACFMTDNQLLAIHLTGDGAVGQLTRSGLRSAINYEAINLNRYVPGTTVDVVIEETAHVIGTGRVADGRVAFVQKGNAAEPRYIRIRTNLTHSSDKIIRHILSVLRHELHHYRFFQKGYRVDRLLDQLIYEGLAVALEIECDPDDPPVYAQAVAFEDLKQLWQQTVPVLHETGLYQEWMFGKGVLPRWSGYTLGLEMVRSYLRHHPSLSLVDLMEVPSEDYIRYVTM